MKLLTAELRKQLPKLYAQENKPEIVIYAKFFHPCSNWAWYVAEGEPVLDENGKEVDFIFFGLVDGFEKEWGQFALSELESVRDKFGLGIERDLYFPNMKIPMQPLD